MLKNLKKILNSFFTLRPKELNDCYEGIIAINKPLGISSQKAVSRIKYWARKKTGNKKIRVGHAGTLDPLATGVLVVAIGRTYTKQIDTYVQAQKEYEAEITLGATSETYDGEGPITINEAYQSPGSEEIQRALDSFVGDIEQVPPSYSAIKIDGQEAYKRKRRGESVEMQSRTVHIQSISLLGFDGDRKISIRVICGKGTYIRSLAHDIGEKLGCGGYMSGLVRTRVGQFNLSNAYDLEDFS